MPKIPNTTARDIKPHPLSVGTLVAIGACVGGGAHSGVKPPKTGPPSELDYCTNISSE